MQRYHRSGTEAAARRDYSRRREQIKTGLAGEIVLITGATRDHDRDSTLSFADEGAHLLLCTRQIMELLARIIHES
jgi:NADP-dependent 3-hydroxy acid dehydrogenase YdfG